MNIAYFIYHGKIDEWDLFDVSIKSLQKVSDCKIVVFTPGLKNHEHLENLGVQVVHFPMAKWENRKMTCKVECILTLPESCGLKYGDNVMVFDADLLFIKDPFNAFKEHEFDFMYTTRNTSNEYPVNGGVWGFRYNENSNNLLHFFVGNLNNPVWPPYVNARKHHVHNKDLDNLDWWVDQDFLCELHKNEDNINQSKMLGFDINIKDVGPEYNWIYSGMNELDQIDHIKNKKSHILHYKGATSAGITSNRYLKETNEKQVKFYKILLDLI